MSQATAVFGGGCFWCVEAIFSELSGVLEVIPGYSGGHVENPTYEQVCTDTTGHAEVVQVTYDPSPSVTKICCASSSAPMIPPPSTARGRTWAPSTARVIFTAVKSSAKVQSGLRRKWLPSGMTPLSREIVPLERFYPLGRLSLGLFQAQPPERLLQHGHCSQGGQVPQRIQPAAKGALTGETSMVAK